MRFSTALYTIALAATGITAAPAVEERQSFGFAVLQFFNEPGCVGTPFTSDTLVDNGATSTNVCRDSGIGRGVPYGSFRVRYNELVRPATLYTFWGCPHEALEYQIGPDTPLNTCIEKRYESATFK